MTRHRFEAASLVFGLLFAGIGLLFLQGDVDLWQLDWSWVWPIALLVAGGLVLQSARADRRTSDLPTSSDDDPTAA